MILDAAVVVVLIIGAVAAARTFGFLSLQAFSSLLFLVGFGIRIAYLDLSGQHTVFRYLFVSQTLHDQLAIFAAISFVAMYIGYLVGGRYSAVSAAEVAKNCDVQYRSWTLILVFIGTVMVQLALIRGALGGTISAIETLSRRSITSSSIGISANLTFVAMPILLLALLNAHSARSRGAVAACISLLLITLPWFVIVNGRAIAIVAVWAIAAILAVGIRPVKVTALRSLVGVVGAMIATVVGFAWRYSSQSGLDFGAAIQSAMGEAPRIVSDAIPLFDHFRVALSYATQAGEDGGASLLTAFTVLVPRALWPEKPQFLPQLIGAHVLHYGDSGLPAGLLGEGYIALGWWGAVVYALIFGLIVSWMQRLTTRFAAVSASRVATVYFGALLLLTTIRTGPQGGLISAQIALVYAPALFLLARLSRVRRSRSEGAMRPESGETTGNLRPMAKLVARGER